MTTGTLTSLLRDEEMLVQRFSANCGQMHVFTNVGLFYSNNNQDWMFEPTREVVTPELLRRIAQ